MVFFDLVLWVCVVIFLIGLVFVFEATLSSGFGFMLLIGACGYFSSYFWREGMVIFGVMFVVFLILAIRFLFGEISKSRGKWR